MTNEEIIKICRQWAWNIRTEAEALGLDAEQRAEILKSTGEALCELAEGERTPNATVVD